MLLILVLGWPLLFAGSTFNGDWLAQAWFIWQQNLAIHADHLPSLFINYRDGVFYPHYAFYGGTLYALAATLSLILGNSPIEAYVLTYLLGFAAAYGGWYWIARMSGLRRWWAHVPGFVFITSAYYLTLIYARGDWPEFIGVSMIPLIIAAGLSVLRAERLRLWPAVALTLASVVFFGSHSLTLVWGSTLMILVGGAILVCSAQARRQVTRAGVIRVAGIVLPALLVSGWFLVPAIAYESSTRIAVQYPHWQLLLRGTMSLVSVQHLFTFSRASASTPGAAFALSLPILVMVWALVGIALLALPRLRETWARIALLCAVLTAAMVVLMTHAGLILALPRAYATLQFSYRLESYVLLGLSGTILAILVRAKGTGGRLRLWAWVLPPMLVVSLVGAIQQADAYPHSQLDRYTEFHRLYTTPTAGEELIDYTDVELPILNVAPNQLLSVVFPPAAVRDDRVSLAEHLRAGQLVETNIQGPPSLVRVTGAQIVAINLTGYDILEVDPAAATGGASAYGSGATRARTISLSPAENFPVVLGRALTICGLILLALQFAALSVRRLRVSSAARDAARSRA